LKKKTIIFITLMFLLISVLMSNVSMADLIWSPQPVPSGEVYEYCSLALDSGGNPHISYYDKSNKDLMYAYRQGSTWVTESVDKNGDVGRYSSLALDSSDNPHISYYDLTNSHLKYAKWTGAWVTTTVDDEGWNGQYSSLALYDDKPRISYYSDQEDGSLRYAKWTGSTWIKETVLDHIMGGECTSLAMDFFGNPHITFEATGALLFAKNYGSFWDVETMWSGSYNVKYNSLALDSSNNPHISYYNENDEHLAYTYWTGSNWHNSFVDENGDVGMYCSLALDTYDLPHISYYDATNKDLKYAYWDDVHDTWVTESVDKDGSVGMYTSLATTGGWIWARPHIIYYDESNKNLKYAEKVEPPYDARISAWSTPAWAELPISMDGVATGFNTPHTFEDLTGTHYFTLPETANSYLFTEWTKEGSTVTASSILTIDSGGTYVAQYTGEPGSDFRIRAWSTWGWEFLPIIVEGSSIFHFTPYTFENRQDPLTLTLAETAHDYLFTEWEKDGSTYSTSRTITVTEGGTYTALYTGYARIRAWSTWGWETLRITLEGSNMFHFTPYTFENLQGSNTFTLPETAHDYLFTEWEKDGSTYSTSRTLTVTTPGGTYTAMYTTLPKVATPMFNPGGGTYSSSQSVTLSCSTSGATIRYTIDDSEPTASSTIYSSAISVGATTTIKAKAFKTDMTDSDTATAAYTINISPETVATPTLSPGGGTYTSAQTVTISCATSGATIRYTTDGSEPSSTSTTYSSPISVGATTTIKAKAFKSGMTDSATATAVYTISMSPETVITPTFSPTSGSYASAQSVTLNCNTTDATIRYTIDGSEPTASSTIYSSPISVGVTTTIKAKAFKSGMTDSATASATYVVQSGDDKLGELLLIVGIVILVIAIIVAAILLWRRKKNAPAPGKSK
jgi:hypothetical protein